MMMMNTTPPTIQETNRNTRFEGFLASILRVVWPEADCKTLRPVLNAALPCCTSDPTASVAWMTDYGAMFYATDAIELEILITDTNIDHNILLQTLTQKSQQCSGHSISYQVIFTARNPALFDHPLTHRYYDRLRFLPPYHSGYRAIEAGGEFALLPPRYRMEPIDDEGNRVQVICEGF
jgi:hypothetical protein